jgi:hypothetical protein
MPGIFWKFKTLTKLGNQFLPLLNNIIPGLGDGAQLALKGVEAGWHFINGFVDGFRGNKSSSHKRYKFVDGLKGGLGGLDAWKNSEFG